ncbi:Quercetin 2-3-dioxygenase [Apiospora sp. TS-2023a]
MSIPITTAPPPARTTYILDQLEGERLTIPGSKGVFHILASSKQTNGGIAVFSSGAVLSDAPGFHWHEEAHDVFVVTKGFLKLWNGDKCRIIGPGDFAYVPPKVIHNPELLGPHTETFGLVAPGDWVDFFRYVAETYEGVVIPEHDDRDLKSLLMQKMMATNDRFDVHFQRGGTTSRPRWGSGRHRRISWRDRCAGKFAISSIESSRVYNDALKRPLARWLTFADVDHCFCVQEGLLRVRLRSGDGGWSEVRAGQTLVVAAGETFTLDFGSRYVRVWSFTNGRGIEELIRVAGSSCSSFVLPERPAPWEESEFLQACQKVKVEVADL